LSSKVQTTLAGPLNNDLGREFLRALRDKNALLRKHINDHVHFIKTIYLLRDVVLHREGLQATSFENMSIDEPWRANFIRVPAETATLLKQCKDKNEDYEPWTHFGIFSESYLEPFKFAKSSVLILADFCNEYLKLLGFKNFVVDIKKNKPQESFVRDLEVFEENNIGL
jgi:hypothetical protein